MNLVIDEKLLKNVLWQKVERSITEMNGKDKRWVVLVCNDDMISPRIIASGGENDNILLDFVDENDDIPISCINSDNSSDVIVIWDGGHYSENPAKYVVSKSVAIKAFKYFYKFQGRHPELLWEE